MLKQVFMNMCKHAVERLGTGTINIWCILEQLYTLLKFLRNFIEISVVFFYYYLFWKGGGQFEQVTVKVFTIFITSKKSDNLSSVPSYYFCIMLLRIFWWSLSYYPKIWRKISFQMVVNIFIKVWMWCIAITQSHIE